VKFVNCGIGSKNGGVNATIFESKTRVSGAKTLFFGVKFLGFALIGLANGLF
jgi:hypothetical protein